MSYSVLNFDKDFKSEQFNHSIINKITKIKSDNKSKYKKALNIGIRQNNVYDKVAYFRDEINNKITKYDKYNEYIKHANTNNFKTIFSDNNNNNNIKLLNRYNSIFKGENIEVIRPEYFLDGYNFNNFNKQEAYKNLLKNNNKKSNITDDDNNNQVEKIYEKIVNTKNEITKNYFICNNNNIINKLIPNIYNFTQVYSDDIIELLLEELLLEEVKEINKIY